MKQERNYIGFKKYINWTLGAINYVAYIYFTAWLLVQFYLMAKYSLIKIPALSGELTDIGNVVALGTLFVVIFIPSKLFKLKEKEKKDVKTV